MIVQVLSTVLFFFLVSAIGFGSLVSAGDETTWDKKFNRRFDGRMRG
jgi:hypothetical protein